MVSGSPEPSPGPACSRHSGRLYRRDVTVRESQSGRAGCHIRVGRDKQGGEGERGQVRAQTHVVLEGAAASLKASEQRTDTTKRQYDLGHFAQWEAEERRQDC